MDHRPRTRAAVQGPAPDGDAADDAGGHQEVPGLRDDPWHRAGLRPGPGARLWGRSRHPLGLALRHNRCLATSGTTNLPVVGVLGKLRMDDRDAKVVWVKRVLGFDLALSGGLARSAALGREAKVPDARGSACRKLLERWQVAQNEATSALERIGQALVAMPEVKADPRVSASAAYRREAARSDPGSWQPPSGSVEPRASMQGPTPDWRTMRWRPSPPIASRSARRSSWRRSSALRERMSLTCRSLDLI